ncbi:MAG: pyridoxamine 5'-phosphate oxidase family protein [Chromatiales bacterium]|jgi:predicted pyridoxine 5'-phosphate oxidase superfamily flavin-nucleotide-binding protein|nr:pyridoxamine 5'-phosphate oxidase family protein [Chromatiales bacterium]MDX9768574.1 pyridoxamine 5'-phosphate oxidase family protein [Ectothiorhodospiraceae bacterium]
MSNAFHPGELTAQFRFNEDWSEDKSARIASILKPALDERMALFIEGLPFFFLATADDQGHCDCSFRGTDPTPNGGPASAARVIDAQTLVFPDYDGNRMFNSLGNVIANPQVGLLFIDFAGQTRLRVNGGAEIIESASDDASIWPQAKRLIRVEVAQAYWNCSRRIPVDPRVRRGA